MKPAPFTYQRPDTLEEALSAYAAEPDAKILAGGQSLIPLMSMRMTTTRMLIDINGIAQLATITVDDEHVTFGAGVRHSELLAHRDARRVQPLIAAALEYVAHATIRNRGTTVGSIVHADASGEMPMILALTGGSLAVASTRGRRRILPEDLFLGPLETNLESDEIAVAATIPALGPRRGIAFDEIARRHGDYALCGVGAVVELDDAGRVVQARVGYVAMSDVPVVVDVSSYFSDGVITDSAVAAAGESALTHLEPEADIHATAEYREQLARTLTSRVLKAAESDAHSRQGAVS